MHSTKRYLCSVHQCFHFDIPFRFAHTFRVDNNCIDLPLIITSSPLLKTMQNDQGETVDLYIPRKCSASNRIIHAKDHASIQINLAEVDEATGRVTSNHTAYAICGALRRMGESDDCINRLAKKDNILPKNF